MRTKLELKGLSPGSAREPDPPASPKRTGRAAHRDDFRRIHGQKKAVTAEAATAPSLEPRVVELPEGYPKSVDLAALARAAKEILIAQGMSEADFVGVRRLMLTDADLTLFDSPVIPVLLRHKQTHQLLSHPDTKETLRLGVGPDRDVMKEYNAVRGAHQEIAWSEYNPEPASVSHLANILAAKEILPTIHSVKKANADEGSREIVVTARGGDDSVVAGIRELLGRHGARLDGAVMLYHPEHKEKLGLTDEVKGQGRKKALAMAALLTLFDPQAATLKRVRFMDDNDDNLIAAMQLLPKLFPNIRFEFVDVVHLGEGRFEPRLVARSQRGGAIKDAAGKRLDDAQIAAYKSQDAPLPPAKIQE